MAVGDAYVFPGFLTPVLIQLFFPKPPTTFLTCFCRGERRKYAGEKSRLNTESCFRHPLFDLRGTRKVEIRHTNFSTFQLFDFSTFQLFDFSTFQLFDFCFFWSKSGKFFDNCQVKNFNFSTFRGNFFARKVEVSVPNFYFSSSS